jgi:hypothetical protein
LDFARARGLVLMPARSVAPAAYLSYRPEDAQAIETVLKEGTEALETQETERARAKLQDARTRCTEHPELPQAAFLAAEAERALAALYHSEGNRKEQTAAWERARVLDGGRKAALSEHSASMAADEFKTDARLSIPANRTSGLTIWFDGIVSFADSVQNRASVASPLQRDDESSPPSMSVRVPAGVHHLRVSDAVGTLSASWLTLEAGKTFTLPLASPPRPPCSTEEFAQLPNRRTSIMCPAWLAVRNLSNGTFVALCERDNCHGGEWLPARKSERDRTEAKRPSGSSWVPWILAGALGAAATAVTIANLPSTPMNRQPFVNGGLTVAHTP